MSSLGCLGGSRSWLQMLPGSAASSTQHFARRPSGKGRSICSRSNQSSIFGSSLQSIRPTEQATPRTFGLTATRTLLATWPQ
eukprot:15478306-Alexandrium_andersonii.AAC.1